LAKRDRLFTVALLGAPGFCGNFDLRQLRRYKDADAPT
jgi:hypothetical protein